MNRVLSGSLNGRLTYRYDYIANGYEDAKSQIPQSNAWSSTEYNSTNAWNVNFNNGNVNNNNKYNSNVVRPSVAHGDTAVPYEFIDSVYNAFIDCCKGKTQSTQCIEYLSIANIDIITLSCELWTDIYRPTTSTCFLVKYPKWREVFAANFRDRIVHHWLCQYLEPLFETRFREQGDVSFNCRKGYGTNKAVESVYEGVRKVTGNYQRKAWVFKGDLVGFFMSIDKNIMWRLMEKFIKRKYHGLYKDIILCVVKIVIYHRPEIDCVLNSKPEEWLNLASNKSLHRNPPDKGMAIGNLTTQLFANFYMSFFDVYVAYIFRNTNYHYARFVDDFVIICDDRKKLLHSIPIIDKYLHDVLHLRLHHKKHYFQDVSRGISFVGSVIKFGRIYLSNRTIARMIERVHGFNRLMEQRQLNSADVIRIQSVINSYLGFMKGRCTYRRRKEILNMFSQKFYKYFYIEGHYERIKSNINHKQLFLNL